MLRVSRIHTTNGTRILGLVQPDSDSLDSSASLSEISHISGDDFFPPRNGF